MTDQKSYEDMKQDADQRWQRATTAHAGRLRTRQEQIANSPDVLNAPEIGSTWNNPDIRCSSCGQGTYTVLRYACVNGIKHRTELACRFCNKIGTWDFTEAAWLN